MSRFYLEQILIQGNGKEDAVLNLKPGANFVIGPSNTGKSLIMEAIDYVFGMTPKKNRPFKYNESWGYTDFTLQFRTDDGTVVLKRTTGKGKTKVSVSGTDPNFKSGSYAVSGRELNSIYLKLMGIEQPHEVWSSADGRKNQFTWRNIIHMFFLRQQDVTRDSSVLLNPSAGFANNTAVLYSLLFMMTGEDADAGQNPDTQTKRKAKKEAVAAYIRQHVERLDKREEELRTQIEESTVPDMPNAIAVVNQEMDSIQSQISEAVTKSKQLMDDIFAANNRLSESVMIANRFDALKGQYVSDIQRLSFVVEGEKIRSKAPVHRKCPFCDGDIVVEHKPQYVDATCAELKHIEEHLESLETAKRDVLEKIQKLKDQISNLEEEKAKIEQSLNVDLRPRFSELKQKLEAYRAYVQLTHELDLVIEEQERYKKELLATEKAPTSLPKDHIFKDDIDGEIIHGFESILMNMLKESGFNHYSSARLSLDTFDLELGGQPKSQTNGGGYCGILNTIMSLSMMEYLSLHGTYSPGIMYADSSLSQLSESERKARAETIKTKFIQYVARTPRDVQTLVIEHKEKVPFDAIIESGANVVEFTGDDAVEGRYGLLPGVRNAFDQQ